MSPHVRVTLGKTPLPEAFTHGARSVNSGGADNHTSCYLFGGLGSSVDGVDDCRSCAGDKAARLQYRRYLDAGV